jgi:hypothetical protein
MSVISVSIVQSGEELSAGIPRVISISTNVIANIFYTLDGSDPDLFSEIYTGPIQMPSNLNPITLKVYATNGIDSSSIISEVYSTNHLDNTRLPYSATSAPSRELVPNKYPYGTPSIQPEGQYLNPGDAGQTVDDPSLPQIPNGYNSEGLPDGYSNLPFNTENYKIKYTTTNAEGESGKGIGTLPATVTILRPAAPPEETDRYSALFDPRALVIFQDVSKENPNDPPQINRQNFTLESATALDGSYLYNEGPDTAVTSGSFVKSYFNPRENTITYYYLDSRVNRWIISKMPYKQKLGNTGNLYNIFPARNRNMGFVFAWRQYARRILF